MGDSIGWSIAPGAATALAGMGEHDEGYNYLFSEGDLGHLGGIRDQLTQAGFDIGRRDVYAAVKTEEEYIRGLRFIWERKIEGWWNYKRQFERYEICTAAEYDGALSEWCSRR